MIIGILGKWVAPGGKRQHPALADRACGIVGVVLGNWLYGIFGGRCATSGIDWLAFFISIVRRSWSMVVATSVTGRTTQPA